MGSSQHPISSAPFKPKGRFVAEVFKVEYRGKDVETKEQFGTIIVKNRKYHHYIYNVEDTDMCKSSIKSGDLLTLTGPLLSSVGCPSGYLVIDVDLFFGTYKDSIRIDWLPNLKNTLCFYDEKKIKSKDGEVCIHFGMFYDAADALIEVSVSPEDKSAVDVDVDVDFKKVFAGHTSRDDESRYLSLLFEPTGNERKVQGPIPLSRSIVAVPLQYPLVLYFGDDESEEINEKNSLKFENMNDEGPRTLKRDKYVIEAEVTWDLQQKRNGKGDLNDICYYSDEAYER